LDLADPTAVKKAEMKAKDKRRQELKDIKTVLANVSGRRLIWKILERCGTFNSIFNTDPLVMANYSGQQDLGHYLMAEIVEADENLLLKLMKENQKKE
jgi:hypothetical protein